MGLDGVIGTPGRQQSSQSRIYFIACLMLSCYMKLT
jgi:hypothetical protein